MYKYAGAISSDYDASSDVIGKQTVGCHYSNSLVGLQQLPIERVSCSDVTSPEPDAEGKAKVIGKGGV